MNLTLDCQKRPAGSKPNALRRSGRIPAVLYGHQGADSVELTIDAKTVENLLKKASVNNTIIELNVTDLPWNGVTLLREVQKHPWKGYPYHLSFFSVSTQASVEVEIPLHFTGESVGVKLDGGILDIVINSLTVKCPPAGIPAAIDIDVSGLKIGDALHIKELNLPTGVQAVADDNLVVVSVIHSANETTTSEEAEA